MSYAIPVHVALVDDTGSVEPRVLARVAAALNEQVQADFAPAWHVRATVGAYSEAAAVAAGTWALRLRDGIDEPGAAGYHADQHHQPYALIDIGAGGWTVTASHELLEMLADPWGARMHTALAPDGWTAGSHRVRYLLEVCDPCEAATYEVGGVLVSDFLLPHFYRTARVAPRYSMTGAIEKARQVIEGGYVSWLDPATDDWWQRFVEKGKTSDENLGPGDASMSPRAWLDLQARLRRARGAAA